MYLLVIRSTRAGARLDLSCGCLGNDDAAEATSNISSLRGLVATAAAELPALRTTREPDERKLTHGKAQRDDECERVRSAIA